MFAILPILKLLPLRFPVTIKEVPVAAPMFGVVNCAFAITTILPPSIPVVIPSVFAENWTPSSAIPGPAVYVPAPENWVNIIGSVPIVTTVLTCTQPVLP